jgi:hypothetical protein
MSPEQARGLPVDPHRHLEPWCCALRNDGGRVPFEGTPTATCVRLLERWSGEIRADVSPELEWIVEKTLRKDRDGIRPPELLTDLRNLKRRLNLRKAWIIRIAASSAELARRGSGSRETSQVKLSQRDRTRIA